MDSGAQENKGPTTQATFEEPPLEPAPEVSVRAIFRLALEALRAQPLTCALLAMLGVMPAVVVAHANQAWGQMDMLVQATLLIAIGGSARVLSHLAIVYGVVSYLRAAPRSAGEMVTAAALCLPTGAAVFTIIGIAVLTGTLMLVVPGLLLLAVFMPLGAVTVIERRGVSATLRRTYDLTHGHHGTLCLTLLALGAVFVGTFCVPIGCIVPYRIVTEDLVSAPSTTTTVAYVVINTVIGALNHLVAAVVPAAAYQVLSGVPRPKTPAVF